jgi:hypothetical protein
LWVRFPPRPPQRNPGQSSPKSFDFAQDFAGGLRRPQGGSSSIPPRPPIYKINDYADLNHSRYESIVDTIVQLFVLLLFCCDAFIAARFGGELNNEGKGERA